MAAAPCCYFWRATLGQIVLNPGDALLYNFPIRVLAMGMVSAGHLPLWNPFAFSGSPLFGESGSALLYPTTWLFAVLPPSAAANVVVLSAYSVAVIGTYAYARAMGCSPFGAAFGGLTFGFSGFMIAHIGHTQFIQGMACLPWFLLFLDRLRHRAALRDVVGAAAALALVIVSGHPAIPVYVTITGGLYVAFFTWCVPPAVGRRRYLGLAAASVALAIGGCAIQLVPTVELMRQSVRAQLSFEDFVAFSLPLTQLPMLLFPYLFGGGPTTPYWGAWWGMWELTGYIGVAPMMLALASLRILRADAAARFWIAMAGLTLVVVVGDATPLARMLYWVPVYNLFRAPARVIFLFDFAVAVLSAMVLTRFEPAARRALTAGALAVVAAAVTIAALAVLAGRQVWGTLAAQAFPGGLDHEALRGALAIDNPGVAVPVAISAAAAVVLLALARQPSSWWKGCLLAVQLADLYLLGAWMPNVYTSVDFPWVRPNYIQHLNQIEPDPAAFRLVLATAGTHEPTPSAAYALWGVPMVNGYDSLMLSRYGDLTGMDYTGVIPDTLLAGRSAFLDVLNGKYLLAVFPEHTKPFLRVGRIDFALQGLDTDLRPGESAAFGLPRPERTSQVGVVSYLGNSVIIADGTPVARLVLTGTDGRRVERLLRAGVDTADSAWDRPGVSSIVRHRRAPVVHSFATPDGIGHAYGVALGDFEPFDVVAVDVEQLAPAGMFHLARLSLYDATTDRSTAVTALHRVLADRGRWTRRFGNGVVEVLENHDVLPRAWLVPSTTALPATAVTRTVREGRFPDGRRFDPRATALVEDRPGREFGPPDPDAAVRIMTYEPNAVALVARTRVPAMLVLSETFYPGWTATIDDAPVPVVRVDAVLRGVELPAGERVVRFAYRPWSVVIGAAITGVTLLVLLGLGVWRLGMSPPTGAPAEENRDIRATRAAPGLHGSPGAAAGSRGTAPETVRAPTAKSSSTR